VNDAKPSITLKLPPVPHEVTHPWLGDALNRKPFADALTNLLHGQTEPLVLTVNGSWGTGKTFFLKHWQAQLQQDGYQAIYFNAWEDDYNDDPLVAIIGQLWHALKESDFKETANSIKEAAKPLFTKTLFKAVNVITAGVVDVTDADFKSRAELTVEDYFSLRGKRDELHNRLTEMASQVATKTSKPLVFIIDELDRCRPTFAIELLERVKHVFDVHNMVFVLGIDRKQLASSIQSVYGNIDVEGYLRRFFDMEIALPMKGISVFIEHLLKRHGLDVHFEEMSIAASHDIHRQEFRRFQTFFAFLCKIFRLSLRDAEYTVRSFILVAKNLQTRQFMYPDLLSILILVRLKNPELYNRFITGNALAGDMLDYIEAAIPVKDQHGTEDREQIITNMELLLYMASDSYPDPVGPKLEAYRDDRSKTQPLLSKWMRDQPDDTVKQFVTTFLAVQLHSRFQNQMGNADTVKRLAAQIDLASSLLQPGDAD
jgi:hypothetical protein